MNLDEMAIAMVDRAISVGQVALRADASTPTGDLRAALRRIAHERGVRVRTGMLGDVLILARADADLWQQPESVMRARLAAPDQPNVLNKLSSDRSGISDTEKGIRADLRRAPGPMAASSVAGRGPGRSPQSTDWSMASPDQCAPQALSTAGQARPA